MKKNLLATMLVIVSIISNHKPASAQVPLSRTAESMDFWSATRTFPDGIFSSKNLQLAFNQRKTQLLREDDAQFFPNWQSLGPANIAGRMLCLGFHPTDSLVLWAGSASGGLWKSTTAGVGANAWKRVKTGFPVLGVSAIAVSPDGQNLYIGTGEVYNNRQAGNGSSVKTQRGSYGIGILKSTDGGTTWAKSLDWSQSDLRGVQKICLNPSNPNTVFAATTEGVFRSYDAGKNWTRANQTPMAVDLTFATSDTNRLFATFGCFNDAQNGIFRSLDGGSTWIKLTNGLPANYTGKTLLTVVQNQPNTLYASIANADRQIGLFKSTDGGDNWQQLNDEDVSINLGWFSHNVAVSPLNPDVVLHVGVDAWLSTNAGVGFSKISTWDNYPLNRTVDVPRNYIHSDIHAVYFSPFNANKTYFVSDGGIYGNDNLLAFPQTPELRFQQLNGGLQTTQFYANFSNSQQDSTFSIGGMQDNWTAIYDGEANCRRVLGGDGTSTAVHPQDDNIVFASTPFLNVSRSTDRGGNFAPVSFSSQRGVSVFNAPFEFAPSNPEVMYAGGERLLRSVDAGISFIHGDLFADRNNSINNIAVNHLRDSSVLFSTFPTVQATARVLKTDNAGIDIKIATGLPNRVVTDIAFQPQDTNRALLTLGGFGTQHVYRTTDGGLTWLPSGEGLPDLPTNTVLFDPINPQYVFVGNDLGVYYSINAGATWRPLSNTGFPEACIVMDLNLSTQNRKLRAATHGNGIYEMDMLTRQHLGQPLEFAFGSATMETTNQPIRTNFSLTQTRQSDTIAYVANSVRSAQLALPTSLPTATAAVPLYPFPHPLAVPFNDSIFTFKITPTRTIDGREGISTYDLALISRAILDVDTTLLASPFKRIAADINGDGTVDGVDLLLLRRFILHIDESFRNVPQWVFIPKTYKMTASMPPLSQIPQSYFFSPYALRNPNPFAFWAIKMGDVNNSYEPIDGFKSPQNLNPETRSAGVTWATENKFLEAGNTYEVVLKNAKVAALIGFQGTFRLNTEGVEYLGSDSKLLKNFGEANVNVAQNGKIAFSWNTVKNQIFEPESPVLTLKIKAKKSGQLSDFLQLNSDLTNAASFDELGNEQPLLLKFEQPAPAFALDAQPNPFTDFVNVKIGDVTEGSLSYSIFDELGKLVHKNQLNVKKEDTILRLNAATIGLVKSGVYFLKIETNKGHKILKLVKI